MLLLLMMGCKKHETYIVTFNANGGTGTMEAQTFTEGEAQALSRNAFTYDGYTFSGWNTVQGGSGASYSDQQTIIVTSSMTLYAQWTSRGTNPTPGPQATTGTLNGHNWVDLGLPSGTKWATCNVGANTPEEYGNYFAWGEVEMTQKESYDWSTYKYGDELSLTKYCYDSSCGNNGFTDALTTLEASDDAATANWGEPWRMPTYDEMAELRNNCTLTWTEQNGVNGCLFTGINGNSIFLPAGGGYWNSTNHIGSSGSYWSSSLWTEEPQHSWYLYFYQENSCLEYCDMDFSASRFWGFSVRPVYAN